jgi:membrane-associated phospholipid phosphatase
VSRRRPARSGGTADGGWSTGRFTTMWWISLGSFLALLVAEVAGALGPASIDQVAVERVHHAVRAHGWVAHLARAVTVAGVPLVVDAVALVGAALLWWRGRRSDAAVVLASRLLAAVANPIVKSLVHRQRPVLANPIIHVSGYSFPSGHATDAASTYLVIALVLAGSAVRNAGRVMVASAAALCLLVAASRVALGAHFPSDVVAGLALGTAVGAACLSVQRSWQRSVK